MKRFISLTTAFLCVFAVICVIGCKKKSDIVPNNGGGTPTPAEVDYFVDVDFLPKIETDGGLAPRLMANYNDEVVMIELRPHADTLIETVLFLCPNNQACMLCGNDSRMIYAEYDMETNTPSDNILLVTQMADTALLLTKCVIDWITNSITTGDMMVLPINNKTTKNRYKGHDEDIRIQFYNNFVIPLSKELDKVQNAYDFFGSPAGSMIACINSIYSTAAPIILFSDEPELIVENMEYPTTMGVGQAAQVGVLRLFPQNLSDMASRIIAGISWYLSGGNGSVNDYEGGSGGSNGIDWGIFFYQGYKTTTISQSAEPEPMYILSLNVSRITENSAYLDGHIYYNSGITPAEMGYVYKLDGGPENIVEDMDFHGMPINGLQKATKYTAYAYAKSIMGDMVVSPSVTFWTLGFEAFPNSLSFPAEGDTKYVSLSYSEGDISGWDVTSSPSWCSVTKDGDKVFAVTVGATTETRSGTIIVTGYSYALGSVTESIAVTQAGPGFFTGTPFENTSWNVTLSGQCVENGIKRVRETHHDPNGSYYYTYHNESYNETNSIGGNLTPVFTNNRLVLFKNDDGEESFEFINDTIYLTLIMGDESVIVPFINGIANGYTITRYFEDNNVFCLKIECSGVYEESYGTSFGYKYNSNDEIIYKFTINTNNICKIDYALSEDYEVIDYGNEFIGPLQYHSNGTMSGTGTYEHGVRNNLSYKGNNSIDFPLFSKIPIIKQK